AVSESENVNGLDNTGMASTRSHADNTADNPPAPPNSMGLNDAGSEPEEGEEREDGEDEDGEIADPVEPAYDERVSVMDAEFDAIISQLRKENTQSVEQSLATIKDTMVGFQEELRVEEEEERKRKEKERLETLAAQRAANAAAQAAKRANSASKHDAVGSSGARKRQRSKSRDEGSKKSRKKNEPAVALPAKTTSSVNLSAPVAAPALPVDQVPKPEVVANGAVGDISTADGGGSSADGLFGSLGDDMGLDLDMGMGMSGMGEIGGMGGMGIDMDMGMDSMSNGMFGVTDDDFSFFDTVPANQPSGIAASSPPAPQLPAQPVAGAVKTEFAPTSSYQSGIDLGVLSTSASSSGIDGGSSLVSDSLAGRDLVDTAMGDSIDDLFGGDDDDDGMFDSFFGSSSTATAAATAVTATTEVPPVTTSEATVKLEADTTALVSQPTDMPDPLTISLVSPHEGLIADNIPMTGASSGTAPESTTTAVSAADLASPGSYKLTPAPSADMQTPAQTPYVPFPSKSAESADEAVLSRVSNSAVVQGYSAMQATTGIQAPNLQAALPSSTQAAAPLVQKQGTTPLPYSSIATPYDDIGRHAQSWLQDRPTPARLAGDINDLHPQELDPHNIRFTSIMEKSLNPVSWIKRISARRMHHTGRAKGQEPSVPPRRHSSATGKHQILGASTPLSLRRLRGWLVAYKAKSSYAKDFVPKHISMVDSTSAGAGIASADSDVLAPSAAATADTVGTTGDGHQAGEAGNSAAQTAILSGACGPQQVHSKDADRADGAGVGMLEAITTGESNHHDKSEVAGDDCLFGIVSVSDKRQGFRSFTSIINPRQPTGPASRIGQVLGARDGELDLTVNASMLGRLGLPPKQNQGISTTTVTAIDGSRVPWLLLQARGLLERLQALPFKTPVLSWTAAASSAARLAMSPVGVADCTYSVSLTNQWKQAVREQADWPGTVEMLADWAISGDVSTALVQFWNPSEDPTSGGESGLLTLGRLLALDSAPAPQSATAKYRGFVVKKRKASAQLDGGSKGSVVVPSGPGVIEPLLEPHVLVGAHAQQDIGLPATSLTARDSESLYIKRWHYEHRLASCARHQARVAAGEIEETEEGEEREDGEDEASVADDQLESSEDWTDPDAHTAETEDGLRRACISTRPLALRWWAQMQIRPVGASKDVRWCAFVPPADAAGDVSGWCATSKAAVDGFLGDVDTVYHGMHLGTHSPLDLAGILDGVFTQLTEDNSSMGHADLAPTQWAARLRYEAMRLGRCAAHSWYTTCQHRTQRTAAQKAAPTPSLVIYMLVPFAQRPESWVAMAGCAQLAVNEFGRSLSSLIARTTARGVLTSTSMASSQVPWPTLAVYPLPLDQITEWHMAGRDPRVPSVSDTALAIYNKLPEPLALAAVAPTASPSMASPPMPAVLSRRSSTSGATSGHMLIRHAGFFEYSASDKPTMPRGFAHQAVIVSSASSFPAADSAIVPASIPVALAMQRSDISAEDSHALPKSQSALSSLYPQLPSESPLGARPVSSSSEAANELPEVRVRFSGRTIAAGDCLVAHPLRPSDTMTTLHCAYTHAGEWVAVCWCDERGEYVDHAVFANPSPAVSSDVQHRIWDGCLRFRRLFGGQLRVVLCEWRGMSFGQASSWRSFLASNAQPLVPFVHLVGAGVNPRTGLCLFSSAETAEQDAEPMCQSLVLQSQAYVEFNAQNDLLHRPRALLPTAYMIMHQWPAHLPLHCLCIQALDADNDLLTVRAIAKQFHQLAAVRSQGAAYALPLHIDAVNAVRDALQLVI
ncbi:hypothetical protein EC988_001706, partial [Linderina pennispora]